MIKRKKKEFNINTVLEVKGRVLAFANPNKKDINSKYFIFKPFM